MPPFNDQPGSQLPGAVPTIRRRTFSAFLGGGGFLAFVAIVGTGGERTVAIDAPYPPAVVMAVAPSKLLEQLLEDSLVGESGKVRARFVAGPLVNSFPGIDPSVGNQPGVTQVPIADGKEFFHFVSLLPFERKFGDRVGNYLVGYWPGELRTVKTEEYDSPIGFIEVTAENQSMKVSEHFSLGDFITHDKQTAWPKYLVLQELLLDKLELVIADLNRSGIPVRNVRVLSGFRTPYHNLYGLGSEGGARDSRHQYGDGADIIIDNNRDGRMDDLNGDRRINTADLDLVLQAVERVERAHPHLVGGLGKYHAVGPSGPFAHIDVRGYRARWANNTLPRAVAGNTPARPPVGVQRPGEAVKMSRCNTKPEFAALCGKGL